MHRFVAISFLLTALGAPTHAQEKTPEAPFRSLVDAVQKAQKKGRKKKEKQENQAPTGEQTPKAPLRAIFEAVQKAKDSTAQPQKKPADNAEAKPEPSDTQSPAKRLAWRSFDLDGSLRCGVDVQGRAWCWGVQTAALGNGTPPYIESLYAPSRVSGDHTFRMIALDNHYACGIATDGQAWCWGANGFGNLGTGVARSRPARVPVQVKTDQRFHTIDTSDYGACALNSEDRLYCWGGMDGTLLGIGSVPRSNVPVPYAAQYRWKQISLGGTSLCGVTHDGTGYCWGKGGGYAHGNGEFGTKLEPTEVGGEHRWKEIHRGATRACGLTTDGRAWCWGKNGNSWLGHDGAPKGHPAQCARYRWTCAALPMPVDTDVRFTELAVGMYTACGLDAEGRAWCWGEGEGGTLGDGIVKPDHQRKAVKPVQTEVRFRSLVVRGRQACGIAKDDATAWCWGHLFEKAGTPEPVPPPNSDPLGQ